MIPLPGAQNVFVVGPVASGKSYLLNSWLNPLSAVVVYDVAQEYIDDNSFEHISQIKALIDRLEDDPVRFRIAYHPSRPADFQLVLRVLWQLDLERYLFIDEVQEVSHEQIFDTAVRHARKRLLGIVSATQAIKDVSPNYRRNARMVVFFQIAEGNDLDAIRESWGSEVRDAVRELRPLIYDDISEKMEQAPQCLVYSRARKEYRIYDLGTSNEIRDKGQNMPNRLGNKGGEEPEREDEVSESGEEDYT
jgi:GTPase SAR1 family protein